MAQTVTEKVATTILIVETEEVLFNQSELPKVNDSIPADDLPSAVALHVSLNLNFLLKVQITMCGYS
jgi:hypothetical protein